MKFSFLALVPFQARLGPPQNCLDFNEITVCLLEFMPYYVPPWAQVEDNQLVHTADRSNVSMEIHSGIFCAHPHIHRLFLALHTDTIVMMDTVVIYLCLILGWMLIMLVLILIDDPND